MKGFISIRLQKILLFIPFVNCSILFIWLYNYSKMERTKISFIRSFITGICYALPFIVASIILSKLFGHIVLIKYVLNLIMLYLVPFFLGLGLIHSQSKYGINLEKDID